MPGWLARLLGRGTTADADERLLALEREAQGLRLQLQEHAARMTALRQERDRLRDGEEARVAEAVRGRLEGLLTEAAGPVAHKHTGDGPPPPFDADGVRGEAGPLRYELRWTGTQPPLRHLPAGWLYRAPLPRTKLEAPVPDGHAAGRLVIDGRVLEVVGWRATVGHNWGAEHAERWVWLHASGFEDEPDAWLELALARVRVSGLPFSFSARSSPGSTETSLPSPST